MKAVTLDAFDPPPALRDDLPTPTPAPTEVLVRVRASSVNPTDNSIAAGMLKQMGVEYEYPVTLDRDYAGVIEQVGPAVRHPLRRRRRGLRVPPARQSDRPRRELGRADRRPAGHVH